MSIEKYHEITDQLMKDDPQNLYAIVRSHFKNLILKQWGYILRINTLKKEGKDSSFAEKKFHETQKELEQYNLIKMEYNTAFKRATKGKLNQKDIRDLTSISLYD